jgi:hypothetical protein
LIRHFFISWKRSTSFNFSRDGNDEALPMMKNNYSKNTSNTIYNRVFILMWWFTKKQERTPRTAVSCCESALRCTNYCVCVYCTQAIPTGTEYSTHSCKQRRYVVVAHTKQQRVEAEPHTALCVTSYSCTMIVQYYSILEAMTNLHHINTFLKQIKLMITLGAKTTVIIIVA